MPSSVSIWIIYQWKLIVEIKCAALEVVVIVAVVYLDLFSLFDRDDALLACS